MYRGESERAEHMTCPHLWNNMHRNPSNKPPATKQEQLIHTANTVSDTEIRVCWQYLVKCIYVSERLLGWFGFRERLKESPEIFLSHVWIHTEVLIYITTLSIMKKHQTKGPHNSSQSSILKCFLKHWSLLCSFATKQQMPNQFCM